MAIGIFVAPYKRRDRVVEGTTRVGRYCAMDDFTAAIRADGGAWKEVEILGDRALVKVSGVTASTLTAINGGQGIVRLPTSALDDPLSSLTAQQRTALRNLVLDCGYTSQEVQDRFGSNLGAFTLRDVLRFLRTRRKKPRYDVASDAIVCDGADQPCASVEDW